MLFHNPRKEAVFTDWPSGSKRVTCTFKVEANKRGERIARTTTGKPKVTTYYDKIRIVDGDDGKTYMLAESKNYKMISVLSHNMQHSLASHCDFNKDGDYEGLKKLLDSSE